MIYLDNNSTTMVDRRVVDAVTKTFNSNYGNPSCVHGFGLQASVLVEKAKHQVADLINCDPDEVYFTSGATESNNWVINNYNSSDYQPKIILTSKIEHPSILKTLEKSDMYIKCPVDFKGKVNVNFIDDQINNYKSIGLVSIMMVNNETGVTQDIKEISNIINSRIPFHSDITQAVGRLKIDVKDLRLDFASISGHKFHAPKGIGVLYINKNMKINPFITGGGQQNNMRSGTLNVPGIVGIGEASFLCKKEFNDSISKMIKLSNILYYELYSLSRNIIFNSTILDCVWNTVNVSLPGIDTRDLINFLSDKDIFISGGSACSSGKPDPSYVISAMGKSNAISSSTIRISISKFTTEDEIRETTAAIKEYISINNY